MTTKQKQIPMGNTFYFVTLLAIAFAFLLPTPGRTGVSAADPLPVVTSFSILGDMVQNVGGTEVNVTTIIGPGVDAHTFEPTPQQVVKISEAEVIFEIGLDFEPWLDDLYGGSEFKASRVSAAKGVPLRSAGEDPNSRDDQDKFDPHIWMSVSNAMIMVENIRDGLVKVDPDNQATYEANADAYLKQLQELDDSIMSSVATVPESDRKLVTAHDTLGYFADRYGFEIVGTSMGSVTTEGAEPSAAAIAQLIDDIKSSGVKAVFPENVENADLIEQIGKEADVTIGPPLFTDALGDSGSEGDTYIRMMQFDTDAITSSLST